MNSVPEKHREVAYAWIDGAGVEIFIDMVDEWITITGPIFSTHLEYRIKPKPEVKKWRWVRHSVGFPGLAITEGHYTEEQADRRNYLQKIDSTMIEVDAE